MPPIAEIDAPASVLRELWDTTRMRLLVEIGRRGSLSAAARAVGIGQPSASQHLRLLEAAAGQRLVERGGRGSRLTEAGEILAARSAQALASLASADEELAALAGLQTGTIHLGASSVPGIYLLPQALDCFRTDYPAVRVEVKIGSTAGVLGRLLRGDVQLALVGETDAGERVMLRPFLEDELVGIAQPGSLPIADGLVSGKTLEGRLLLSREAGSASRTVAEAALEGAGVRLAGRWELGASEAVKRAAREGLGVAFLSRLAVAEEISRGELESFRIAGMPRIRRSLCVATVAGRDLSPAEQGFIATLTRCCVKTAAFAETHVGRIGA